MLKDKYGRYTDLADLLGMSSDAKPEPPDPSGGHDASPHAGESPQQGRQPPAPARRTRGPMPRNPRPAQAMENER